jgi:tRNA nucleotidyltransferase/poly(A) polymerase
MHNDPTIAIPPIFEEVSAIVGPVYLVGGSVRDVVLGKTPSDYDFCTPLTPDEIEAAVRHANKRPYLIGKKFGTIAFKVGNQMVEVTTFRKEEYVPGSRKPVVEFVDNITHDLSRRDFTINAMALRQDGHVVDPFGGREDLVHGLIRAMGQPQFRYKEDPLRMVRAARLAAQLEFTLEEETQDKIFDHAEKILEVSKERWTQELDKLLMAEKPEVGLRYLAQTRLLNFMLPEMAIQVKWDQDSPYHELELWEHSVKTSTIPSSSSHTRIYLLFIPSPQLLKQW